MIKRLINISIVAVVLVTVASCKKDSRPNYQFMPNMYESVAYETYSQSTAFADGVEAQLPVEGTIARGFSLFEFENTNEDYERAKLELKNPIDSSNIDLDTAKELYTIYCAICHGNGGKGDGQLGLGKRELILPGSYADKDITEGSVYHTIYYGKNLMGSYASQLNEEERWQVAAYVQKLKADLTK